MIINNKPSAILVFTRCDQSSKGHLLSMLVCCNHWVERDKVLFNGLTYSFLRLIPSGPFTLRILHLMVERDLTGEHPARSSQII